jgi:hypothetical protein
MNKLKSKCKCGADIEIDFDKDTKYMAESQFKEWMKNHQDCQPQPLIFPSVYPPNIGGGFPATNTRRGCSICDIGANGEVMGYVCPRNDCPTKVTC